MKKRVVVFGIFDGVHDGHRSLFRQALRQAQGKAKEDVELVVIVGRDSASLKWKDKNPKHSQQTRLSLVIQEEGVSDAVLGDEEQSSYKILESLHPDVICLGYDQDVLEQDIRRWLKERGENIPLIRLKPHQPDLHHNSFYP